jgi:hypothetical protein
MGKKPGRPSGSAQGGGRGRGRPKGRSSQSATPASGILQDEVAPKFKLKVNMGMDSPGPTSHLHPHSTSTQGGDRDQDADLPQQLAQPTPVMTRTGRTVHKPDHYDNVQGSDIDIFIDQNLEDHGDDDRAFLASDPCRYHISDMRRE